MDDNMNTKPAHARTDSEVRLADAPQSSERSFQLSLPKLWAAFRHRRWLAISVGLVLAVAGAALAWCLEKPKYTAVSTVLIKSAAPSLLGKLDPASEIRAEEFHKTQAFLVKSKANLKAAIDMDKVRG